MPKEMFGNVVKSQIQIGTKNGRKRTVVACVWAILVLGFVIGSSLRIGPLPEPKLQAMIYVPPPRVVDIFLPPVPKQTFAKVAEKPAFDPNAAPLVPPDRITPEVPVPEVPVERDVPPGFVPNDLPGNHFAPLEAPTPPEPPPVVPQKPVIVGGSIARPTKVYDARPVYPPIAQSARVQGVVIIEATIGIDGSVQDAKVLRSIPLLDAAAVEAVRQWRFTPTRLNGVPVPVVMTVTVNFTLQ